MTFVMKDTRTDAAGYEAWYHTPRGAWIGNTEFSLIMSLLRPAPNSTILDAGCGTGWFSRRFATQSFQVTGIDPDNAAIAFARTQGHEVTYLQGSATTLPFTSNSFDYTTAITSLCFIDDVSQAMQEMWRVSRYGMALGLLNRHSLLYLQKRGRGSYRGARWDSTREVMKSWIPYLQPVPRNIILRTAIFLPWDNQLAQQVEKLMPAQLPFGGFLAVCLKKS